MHHPETPSKNITNKMFEEIVGSQLIITELKRKKNEAGRQTDLALKRWTDALDDTS
jgi:hypothetical protein